MNKILYLLITFFGLSSLVSGQDFKPGQQAQGMLESKNVTVDHATGMFHYRIPLYTLKSGGYELPISLNYTASGVRTEDRPGITGYNWTLNCGGVVTRTVRGGIADETSGTGYLWQELYSTPLQDDFKKVNRHERDGESDIFTAVFNGQSVNFILTKDDDDKFHAEPLERTNVRIEAEQLNNRITGWVITDESGNRYIYRETETTQNIYKEDANSFNGVRNNTPYNSSWYLTRIEPLNGGEIVFEYEDEPLEQTFSYGYQSKYEYGLPMVEYPFDFSKYQSQFDKAIRDANYWIQDYSNKISIETNLYSYIKPGLWIKNPSLYVTDATINTNKRIMGSLASTDNLGGASYDLYNELGNYIRHYKSSSYSYAPRIVASLQEAQSYILKCMNEQNIITEKEVGNVTYYTTKTPVLSRISCDDKSVRLTYITDSFKKLKGIALYNQPDSLMSCYDLNIENEVLNSISFSGKDNVAISSTSFDYYQIPSDVKTRTDLWGFKRPIILSEENSDSEPYIFYADDEFSKNQSLKEIILNGGDKIKLDYETHRVDKEMTSIQTEYGGIRIKSIILYNISQNANDTIRYIYPVLGRLVHDEASNVEHYNYVGGTDRISSSRIKTKNMAIVNTGNNGVYYPFILEQTGNNGTTAYWFNIPFKAPKYYDIPYVFWLYGLPLGTAQYDKNGNLLEMNTYHYLTDMSFENYKKRYIFTKGKHFIAGDSLLKYNKKNIQVQADEYYMDEEFLSQFYYSQGKINLGGNQYFSPYEKLYKPNIQPRTQYNTIPKQSYQLCYGGKTLLKEQRMYKFSGTVTTEPDESDIDLTAQRTPYQKTVLHYDNLEHSLQPTRTEITDSKGDVYVQATQHVTETDAQDSTIARMQAANMLTPVIKQSRLKNGKLIEQNVFEYETENATDSAGIGLKNEYVYVPQSAVEYTPSYPEPVFGFAQSNYIPVRTYTNERVNGYYMPVQKKENGTTSAIVFDANAKGIYPLLQVSNGGTFRCLALDTKPYFVEPSLRPVPKIIVDRLPATENLFKTIDAFWEKYQSMNFMDSPHNEVIERMSSEGHLTLLKFIKEVVSRGKSKNYQYIDSLLYSLKKNGQILQLRSDYQFCCDKGYLTKDEEYYELALRTCQILYRFNPDIIKFLCYYNAYNYQLYPLFLESAISDDHKRFVLHICSNEAEIPIEYQVVQNGDTLSYTQNFENSTGKSKIAHFKIDLSQYDAGAMLRIRIPIDRCHIYLVPDGYEFDATVYNDDYSVHARFNQSGEAEFYEYDPAGRMIRITDQNGHTRKEYEYHTVTNNE